MSESDTGQVSRFKIEHTEPITNVEGTTNTSDNSQDSSNSHNDGNQILFTAAAQETDKHKRRKNNSKREI